MPPYRRGRRPPHTGTASRQPYQSKQGVRQGGTGQFPSTPSMGSAGRMPSATSSASGFKSSQRPKRATDNTRHTGRQGQFIASSDDITGTGSIASGIYDAAPEVHSLPESPDEVLMALEMKTNGIVGCAYFATATATLYLQEDTRITGFELIDALIFQAQPTSIIAPSRAPENFIDYLDRQSRGAELDEPSSDDDYHGFSLRTVVSSDFSADTGKEVLSSSSLLQARGAHFTSAVEEAQSYIWHGDYEGDRAGSINERNNLMQLGTCINLENRVTLGCAGALVRDLERRRAVALDTGHFRLRSVQTISYRNCMFATADTLLALQIFHPDIRQGAQRNASAGQDTRMAQGRKSIFDLFRSVALTSQGRVKLRELFIRPSTDIHVINARHDAVGRLLDPVNLETVATIRKSLKRVKNIRTLLLQLERGFFLPGNLATIKHSAWSSLHDFCLSTLHIFSTGLSALHDGCGVIGKALSSIDSEAILRVESVLTGHIDFQESKSSGRSTIASGVSDELDNLKSEYGNLQVRLENICEDYRVQLPAGSQETIVGCIFHPEMGYLLIASAALQARLNSQASGSSTGLPPIFSAWEETLHEDGLVYYKTDELGGVDTEFGDLTGQIIELEAQIFYTLGSAVLEEKGALLRASDFIGEIDSIFALAAGAQAFDLNRPKMTSCNVLHIKKGRHLLRELGSGKFVPNDCILAGGSGTDLGGQHDEDIDRLGLAADSPNAVVVTGPNHSGKSVYLKQVATIVFLAHIGSFVPAVEAVVGITDKILTRIATRESVSRDESAFGVDLRQAAFSINFATRQSLVLIDEFGKGTATTDGAALFEALLSHFLDRGREEAPKVLAATHFHEIFDDGKFEKHPGLGLSHMSVSIDPAARRPEEKVKFLHTLRSGRSTESFGCNCAAINGVASSVVERANQITKLLAQGASLEKIFLRSHEGDMKMLQEKEDRVRQFLSKMAEALDSASKFQSPRSMLQVLFETKDVATSV